MVWIVIVAILSGLGIMHLADFFLSGLNTTGQALVTGVAAAIIFGGSKRYLNKLKEDAVIKALEEQARRGPIDIVP